MNYFIIAVGKQKKSPEKEILEKYTKRIKENITIKEINENNMYKISDCKEKQYQLIDSSIPNNSYIISLDEKGENISSKRFSSLISNTIKNNYKDITFIIGGANGLSEKIIEKSNYVLSFGKLTWPHMLIRPMLVEQIYRSSQILANHPYHKV